MKKIYLAALILLVQLPALAIPANPKPFMYTQPDGSEVLLQMHGDEFLSWTTLDGQVVALNEDGFYRSAPAPSAFQIADAARKREQAAQISRIARPGLLSTGEPVPSGIGMGEKHFPVLLIQFSDLKFSVGKDEFNDEMNLKGYSSNGATGSVKDYFEENSRGLFHPEFDVYGPVTVSGTLSSYASSNYGMSSSGAPKLLIEACQILDSSVDFSIYDHDGDGCIDLVFFYFAGYSAASGNENAIWPHQWSAIVNGYNYFDGKLLHSYSCASELVGTPSSGQKRIDGIGTFCHEFSHGLGLPDFYDTDYEGSGGEARAIGPYSLMDTGCYNNSSRTPPYLGYMERYMLGWCKVEPIRSSGRVTLSAVQENDAAVFESANPDEFFIFENRQQSGWDKYLPGKGILVFHVDQASGNVNGSSAASRWSNNTINCYPTHECYDLVEAVYGTSNWKYSPFPGPQNISSFTDKTTPAFVTWKGASMGFDITGIVEEGGEVSFYVSNGTILKGKVVDSSSSPAAGVKVELSLDNLFFETTTDSSGEYAFDLSEQFKNVTQRRAYISLSSPKYLSLINAERAISSGVNEENFSLQPFSSSPIYTSGFNAIHSPKAVYTAGRTLELNLVSSKNPPMSVQWYYDGEAVSSGSVILTSGQHQIKAVLTFQNGSKETILQEIVVN